MKQTKLALAATLTIAMVLTGLADADEVVVESAENVVEVEVVEVVDVEVDVEESTEDDEMMMAMETSVPHEVWWGNRSHSFGNYLRFNKERDCAGICERCDTNMICCDTGCPCASCKYVCDDCDDCPPSHFDKIFFGLNKAVLRPEGIAECEKAIAFLNAHPEKNVLIEGHTCDLARDPYNDALGHRRAEAVRSYLVNQGIDPARISTKSFGEANPWVNTSQRELNRRAIIIVLSD